MPTQEERELFRCPPMSARPAPFWFWNDRLDPRRLIDQFDSLLDAGAGGAVLHARGGLDPDEYLDEHWFAAIEAVLLRARERGAFVWLYDELGWPSGTVAGRLPRQYPELQLLHLRMHDVVVGANELPDDFDRAVAVFQVFDDAEKRGFLRRYDGGTSLLAERIAYEQLDQLDDLEEHEGERLLIFTRTVSEGMPNHFDPAATDKFLEMVHEQYYRRFEQYFGTTVTHFFMDETGMRGSASSLPWDREFAEEFLLRRGYDIIPELPALFFETNDHEKVRFDYWSLVAEKFREGFAMRMNSWCEAHGVKYSGHYDFEAPLKEAIRQTGAVMPLYEHQGMVGIDILGNDFYSRRFQPEPYYYYVTTIKQASSVNRQLDKGGVMSESYGVGGHAMDPRAMQSASNFQLALGVTFFSQHAPFYSIRGNRKYDCPPFIDWHEPYWPYIRKHFDALGRAGWLLNQGRAKVDVLLLHPASSMQANYRLFRCREEYKTESYILDADLPFEMVEKHLALISSALLDAQIDFDYGDEELMAKYGAVHGSKLAIGEMRYRAVVVPPVTNMRSSTLDLLRAFAKQDGSIVTVGSAPYLVDGLPSGEAKRFFDDHALRIFEGVDRFDYAGLVDALTNAGARTATVKDWNGSDVPGIKVQKREWDGVEILYLANVSTEPAAARLSLGHHPSGSIEEWDMASGEVRPIAMEAESQTLELHWEARQARAFVLSMEKTNATKTRETMVGIVNPEWHGRRASANVLVLDTASVVDAPEDDEARPLWRIREMIEAGRAMGHKPVALTTRYSFEVSKDNPPPGPLEVAVEWHEGMRISLNGDPVEGEPVGDVLDPAIRRFTLPPTRAGMNTLEICGVYSTEEELQSPWIMGDFSLRTDDNPLFVVEAAPATMPVGSWVDNGAPFYAGTVVYTTEVQREGDGRVVLEMDGLVGSAEVRVNGEVAGHVLWEPYCVDITRWLRPGLNSIEVEVANTVRNLFGPHYEPNEADMTGLGDSSYRGEVGETMRFLDYGLISAPLLCVLRKEGC